MLHLALRAEATTKTLTSVVLKLRSWDSIARALNFDVRREHRLAPFGARIRITDQSRGSREDVFMVTQPPSPPSIPPPPGSPSGTSTGKVVVAAILCWVLGVWFGNIISLTIGQALVPLGFLAAVWIASRIARERTLTAAIPTGVFFLLLITIAVAQPQELKDPLRYGLTALGTGVASLGFAWWLARRAEVKAPSL